MLREFVPIADENGRMYANELAYFKFLIKQGHRRRSDGTLWETPRGIYAFAPSGKLLVSTRDVSPVMVARHLESALEIWRRMPERDRYLPDDSPIRLRDEHRRPTPPEGGLRLRVTARDVHKPIQSRRTRSGEWNQDNAWFLSSEARSMLPETIENGAKHVVPAGIIERLARLHLLDFVRSGASALPATAIREAKLESEIVGQDGDTVRVRFTGGTRTSATSRYGDHGIALKLLGFATFDLQARRFTTFELVGLGSRWGADDWNGREAQLRPSAIGIALVLENGDGAHLRLPPVFIGYYGWPREE